MLCLPYNTSEGHSSKTHHRWCTYWPPSRGKARDWVDSVAAASVCTTNAAGREIVLRSSVYQPPNCYNSSSAVEFGIDRTLPFTTTKRYIEIWRTYFRFVHLHMWDGFKPKICYRIACLPTYNLVSHLHTHTYTRPVWQRSASVSYWIRIWVAAM